MKQKTCILCNVTTEEGYRFDSHLSTDAHVERKIKADRDELISALDFLLRAARTEPGMKIYGAHMDAAQLALDNAYMNDAR